MSKRNWYQVIIDKKLHVAVEAILDNDHRFRIREWPKYSKFVDQRSLKLKKRYRIWRIQSVDCVRALKVGLRFYDRTEAMMNEYIKSGAKKRAAMLKKSGGKSFTFRSK